ncbi:MAG: sialidase family protein [Actinomycetota bacterium]
MARGAYCWNPKVAFGPGGTLYYVFHDGFYFGDGGRRVLIAASRDGGKTFDAPVAVSPPAANDNQFWPAVAVDQKTGRIYVAWTRLEKDGVLAWGAIEIASSSDGARSFGPSARVSGLQLVAEGPAIAVGSDGRLYVSYLENDGTLFVPSHELATGDMRVATSNDNGRTFAINTIAKVALGCRIGYCDRLHSDGFFRINSVQTGSSPGEVYVAWFEDALLDGDERARVRLASSVDGGESWTGPRVIGIPMGGKAHHQHRPWLSVSPAGRIDVGYYDREGPNQGGVQNVYVTSSEGGTTFSVPVKVTDVASRSRVGPTGRVPPNYTSWGDFLGVASSSTAAFVAWTDSRNGDRTTGRQDIFFARIARP